MCGFSAIFGRGWTASKLERMVGSQNHRGKDFTGTYVSTDGVAGLGHNRLSIIDLSEAGKQPFADASGRYRVVFNGEIYNYLELRTELKDLYLFQTETDTEVLLAAWIHWGPDCLNRFVGMFAFVIWDDLLKQAFGARDRFGVKPFHYTTDSMGCIYIASEIKALHSAGLARDFDPVSWSTYFAHGLSDHSGRTFWQGIHQLPAGCKMSWSSQLGLRVGRWYDLCERLTTKGPDLREEGDVADELLSLLEQTIRLRFRSDVPVGICLSGGFDSSLLLGLVLRELGNDAEIRAFHFGCGVPEYDEAPWVKKMLKGIPHIPLTVTNLGVGEIPHLAALAQFYHDEPYGGLPTLGMVKLHKSALDRGVTVLLDGNGLDEAFAGYDYYRDPSRVEYSKAPIQGTSQSIYRSGALRPEFAQLARRLDSDCLIEDPLTRLQFRDITSTKIPRAMRYADRSSMMHGRELREPFLDHRIVELGLRQPPRRKVYDGQGKRLLRLLGARIMPEEIRLAPKRPVQTPQREWFRGELSSWVRDGIEESLALFPDWFIKKEVQTAVERYMLGEGDNSHFLWQWISVGLTWNARVRLEFNGAPS